MILCNEDTYSVATRLKELRFKIRPADTDKIEAAKNLIRAGIDTAALVEAIREG